MSDLPPLESKKSLFSRPWFLSLFLGMFGLFLFSASLLRENDHTTVQLTVPRNSTLASVSELLYENKIIRHPVLFRRVAQLTGGAKKVRPGEFMFHRNMFWVDAMWTLYYQQPIVYSVTVPEGYNIRQIAQALEMQQLVDSKKFLNLALSSTAARKYGLKSPTLEGFLFPDTYTFSKVDGEEKILDRMVQRFLNKLDTDLRNRIRVSGMSLEEVVTLASIIEKETGAPQERPIISSVFHNRIRKGMRLQSDPTTIYGIADFDGNLKKKHLLEHTPYNTYAIKGLPPGPIASPGLEAIRAALAPAQTGYLYFVAVAAGTHAFSETYEQHARLVDRYQKRRPNRASASENSN